MEEVSPTGGIIKRTQHRNITLTLGRDEFSEIQLRIEIPKKVLYCSVFAGNFKFRPIVRF
jgi:hypothetical protein